MRTSATNQRGRCGGGEATVEKESLFLVQSNLRSVSSSEVEEQEAVMVRC